MMGLIGFGWIKIAMVVGAAALVGLAYWHYTSLLSERDSLSKTVEIQQRELDRWADQWENLRKGLEHVERLRAAATAYNEDLAELLAKHDLNRLAVAKPGLIVRRINSATADRFRVFECITNPQCTGTGDRPTDDPASEDAPD